MKPELFVDAGAWLAVVNPRDRLTRAASEFYPRALREYGQLVTTNLVLSETFSLARRRCDLAKALSFLDIVESSDRITKVCSDEILERSARDWLARFADQDFTYVDAVSFSLMQSRGIKDAFAFDIHFQIAGFNRRPDQASAANGI